MTKIDSPRTRSRKLWDKHGSWLILIFVIGIAFNGGVEWQSYKTQAIIEVVVASHVKEREELRTRLRLVTDANQEMARQLGPAVQEAATASEKAGKAVQKADETIDKANKLIEANK